MGANSQEYNKSLVERLEEDHAKSYLGKKYDKLAQKTGPIGTIGGMMAPMAGGAVGNLAAGVTGNAEWSDYATMGGSAIGAAMAPIMYRGMQKQATKDIKDTNSRNIDLKRGGKVSGVQALDSMLNAGKSSKGAFMGGMAGGYGYGALTGNMMDPATMMLAGKASSALSNPGAMAYLAASQMAGANYFGNIFGNEKTHQAALLGSSVQGLGGMASHFGFEGLGKGLTDMGGGIHDMTGMGGSLTGMLTYMLASAGGNKLMKSIKSSAQAKDTKKYNYKIGDLGRPASTDRDVTKYDTMKSVAAQVNLLTVTGQLSPFESLALGYYQSMDKHLLFLNAIYDILNDEEHSKLNKKEDIFGTHNEIGDLFNEFAYDENGFSTKNSYIKKEKKGYAERTGDRLSDIYHDTTEFLQNASTDTNAFFEAWNPLKILTGGLLGNSSTKNIKALYGLDEESKKDDAIAQTASNINVPSSMVQVAEMDISQVMKMSDTIEGKQLAVQSFSASLLQNLLRLRLEEKSKSETGSSFFNQTQKNYDSLNHDSWFDKLKDSAVMGLGNVPILNVIAAEIMAGKGRKKRKEDLDNVKGPQIVESLALSESNEINNDDFLSLQFPSLFLENISLDEERNQLLRQMLECWNCDLSKIKKKSFGVYDAINGQVTDEVGVQNSFKDKFNEDSSSIYEQYKLAIENDPKNEKEYLVRRDEEILGLKKKLVNSYEQSSLKFSDVSSNSIGASQEKEKDEKYKSKMLEAFEAIAENNKNKKDDINENDINNNQNKMGMVKSGWSQYKGLVSKYGLMFGSLFGAGKLAGNLTKMAVKSLFSFVVSHKKMGTALGAAAALGYLAYNYKDDETVKKGINTLTGWTKAITDKVSFSTDIDDYSNAALVGMFGRAVMFLPIPGARIVGGLIMAGAGLLTLNYDKIADDFAAEYPKLAKFLHIGSKNNYSVKNTNGQSNAVGGMGVSREARIRNEQLKQDLKYANKLRHVELLKVTDLKKELQYIKDDKLRKRAESLLDKLNKDKSDYIDKADRKGREKEFDNLQKELNKILEHSLGANSSIILKYIEAHTELSKKERIQMSSDNAIQNIHLRNLISEQISASKYQIAAIRPKEDILIR